MQWASFPQAGDCRTGKRGPVRSSGSRLPFWGKPWGCPCTSSWRAVLSNHGSVGGSDKTIGSKPPLLVKGPIIFSLPISIILACRPHTDLKKTGLTACERTGQKLLVRHFELWVYISGLSACGRNGCAPPPGGGELSKRSAGPAPRQPGLGAGSAQ